MTGIERRSPGSIPAANAPAALGHELDLAADEAQALVREQRAGQEPGLAEHLEAVADAEHRHPGVGELGHRAHRRREAGDRARSQVVAVGEAAGHDDRVEVGEVGLLVPDEPRLADPLAGGERVALVAGARELEDAERGHGLPSISIS